MSNTRNFSAAFDIASAPAAQHDDDGEKQEQCRIIATEDFYQCRRAGSRDPGPMAADSSSLNWQNPNRGDVMECDGAHYDIAFEFRSTHQ